DGVEQLTVPNGETSREVTLPITMGLHDLRLVYHDLGGDARISFSGEFTGADWLPVTLDNSGAGVSNSEWQFALPEGIEGTYQIDLRARDVAGNLNEERSSWVQWRGDIDTAAPRVFFDVDFTGFGE